MKRPILCLDFDGVIHSYKTKWQHATIIPDPPVPGAIEFIEAASESFAIHIFSSRSKTMQGRVAMKRWLACHLLQHFEDDRVATKRLLDKIKWPETKPPAFLTIDDRAWQFRGVFPSITEMQRFKPWNK